MALAFVSFFHYLRAMIPLGFFCLLFFAIQVASFRIFTHPTLKYIKPASWERTGKQLNYIRFFHRKSSSFRCRCKVDEDDYAAPADSIFDMFGEVKDDELLESLRLQKQLENDRWQSCLFRDTHCGTWKGNFETFLPVFSESGVVIKNTDVGQVVTRMSAGNFTDVGVSIFCVESYESDRTEVSSKYNRILQQETKSNYDSSEFRTTVGNQVVGNVYTLNRVEFGGGEKGSEINYVAELAIRVGKQRTRCRYAYSNKKTFAISDDEASSYQLYLVGFTVIREFLSDIVSYTDLITDPVLGSGVYDPQFNGEPYVELNMPGRVSLFFPRALKDNTQQVLTMELQDDEMRFQADRRIFTLNGSIKSLELTEIRTEDADRYPPGFVHVDLLK